MEPDEESDAMKAGSQTHSSYLEAQTLVCRFTKAVIAMADAESRTTFAGGSVKGPDRAGSQP